MKKYLLLLGGMIISFAVLSATPFFPVTNLMEVSVGNNSYIGEINTGNLRLENTYSEEELIILHYYPASSEYGNAQTQNLLDNLGASDDVSVFINGTKKLNRYNPVVMYGQPVYGMMKTHKFGSSAMYIDYLNLSDHQVSFIIRDAADGVTHSNLTLSYMLVEKEINSTNRNVVRYIHNETLSISNDGEIVNKSYTFPETVSNNHKAVIVIRDADFNVLQASSTDVVKAPFRIVNKNNLSLIGPSTGTIDYEYFAIVNTSYDTDGLMDLNVQLINDGLPQNWDASFCDHSGCFVFGVADVQVPDGGYHEFHATVYPSGRGSGQFSLRAEVNEHIEYVHHYYITNDVDIFVIQDNMNEDDTYLIDALTYENYVTVGIFRAGYANYNPYVLPESNVIIWNVPSVYPFLNYDQLSSLYTRIQTGTKFLVIGQFIADVLNSDNTFSYANDVTNDFLNNVLGVNFVESTNASYDINGQTEIFLNFNFNLINDNSINAHFSTNHISNNNSTIAFMDGYDNIKGVYKDVILGETVFYDFDLKSIVDPYHRWNLVAITMHHFGIITSIEDITVQPVENQVLKVSVYPNPVKHIVNIDVESSAKLNSNPEIEIFNIKGQRIYKSSMVHSKNGYNSNLRLDSMNLSSGIYFIKVSNEESVKTQKILFIKE